MQLFYNPTISSDSQDLLMTKDESRHISRVLRKKTGDHIFICNGKGGIFEAEINQATEKSCLLKIIRHSQQAPLPYALHLAVAPTKLNERFEWFLEKATEIGVSEITPIICQHSERRKIKLERYQKIVQSAMKQSLKAYLPVLNPAISFKAFIEKPREDHMYIAHCENEQKTLLKSLLKPKSNSTILIGPEGDFSPEEITLALQHNWQPISLGETRLRTETAALVACHSVAFINQ